MTYDRGSRMSQGFQKGAFREHLGVLPTTQGYRNENANLGDDVLPEPAVILLFWLCLCLVAYTYVGYAVLLRMQVILQKCPVIQEAITPNVSIILAVLNGEANLASKLQNLQLQDYPASRVQIVVSSDGSTDRTAEILRMHSSGLLPVILDQSNGKAYAVNEAVKRATGEILVFQDVRQRVGVDTISKLVSCFADPMVGAVSGELLLETESGEPSPDALGLYWRIEKEIQSWSLRRGRLSA